MIAHIMRPLRVLYIKKGGDNGYRKFSLQKIMSNDIGFYRALETNSLALDKQQQVILVFSTFFFRRNINRKSLPKAF
jgi:hypothetical protein